MPEDDQQESGSVFFLKIVLFFIIGSVWLRFDQLDFLGISAVPIGIIIGLIFANHDHFAIDRKLEYVVLLISMVVSYFLPIGIVI